jgi:ribosomal-protein-alanine N-acetyltransferase
MTIRELSPGPVLEAAAALDPQWTAGDLNRIAQREFPERICLVAEEPPGRLCGWVLAALTPPEGEILDLVVAPDRRRQGIGITLMRTVLERMASAGTRRVWLEVRASNLPALGLYQNLGFRQSGRRTRYYRDPEEDALLLESPLPLC